MNISTEEGERRRVHHMHKAGLGAAEKISKRHAPHYTCDTPVAWAERVRARDCKDVAQVRKTKIRCRLQGLNPVRS